MRATAGHSGLMTAPRLHLKLNRVRVLRSRAATRAARDSQLVVGDLCTLLAACGLAEEGRTRRQHGLVSDREITPMQLMKALACHTMVVSFVCALEMSLAVLIDAGEGIVDGDLTYHPLLVLALAWTRPSLRMFGILGCWRTPSRQIGSSSAGSPVNARWGRELLAHATYSDS